MGAPIYIADPVVAAAYHASPGQFVWVGDDDEAAWLVENRHGFTLSRPVALPAAYYVNQQAPPFEPYVPEAGPVEAGKPAKPAKPARTRAEA
jgi:hypothetical protein